MGTQVDLMAPGVSIQSSVPVVPASTTTYAFFSGTSMATPHVAGAFAAIRTFCPSLPDPVVDRIEFGLINSGRLIADGRPACPGNPGCPTGVTRPAGSFTKPRIRVDAAVQGLLQGNPSYCNTRLTVSNPAAGTTVFRGVPGGPFIADEFPGFTVSSTTYESLNFSISGIPSWLSVAPTSGSVDFGNPYTVLLSATPGADSLPVGTYSSTLVFTNTTNGQGNAERPVSLVVKALGTHDFNGNGYSDILWRHAGGATAVWLMFFASVQQTGNLGTVPANWQIVGQLDFNGDGKYDLLWRDTTTGTLAIWFLDGTQVVSTANLGAVATNWQVVGVRRGRDSTGTWYSALLWRDTSNGVVAVWLLDGHTAQRVATLSFATVPTNWQIAGFADFNGDGYPDILWRDTSSGTVAIWFMTPSVQPVLSTASLGAVPLSWQIVGTGNFNADRMADILWRDSNGNVAIWQMNGAQIARTASLGAVPGNWSIQQTGDFDANGHSDILWRDTATGTAAIWSINNLQLNWTNPIGTIATDWTIQNVNAD
jgi:hypothetical protein